jgi:hypothetical protein
MKLTPSDDEKRERCDPLCAYARFRQSLSNHPDVRKEVRRMANLSTPFKIKHILHI